MHDGGDQGRRRAALAHGFVHMPGFARAARGNDRNGHGVHNGAGQLELVTVLGAVGIDGIDAELARAQILTAPGPGQGVQAYAARRRGSQIS